MRPLYRGEKFLINVDPFLIKLMRREKSRDLITRNRNLNDYQLEIVSVFCLKVEEFQHLAW